jgi:hypothetical protein
LLSVLFMMVRTIVSAVTIALLGADSMASGAQAAPYAVVPCAAPYDDPQQGPFVSRDYITGVEPHRVAQFYDKQRFGRLEGAVVNLRAAPGVTREWLQQLVDDHLQTAYASGPTSYADPLAVKGASARVSSTSNGFAITIDGKDRDAAKEILRRSEALLRSGTY